MVFFEAPHRTEATLRAMAEAWGADRTAAVCRELTKTHEEIRRDSLDALVEWAAQSGPRGEITIVVGGAVAEVVHVSPEEAAAMVADRESTGVARKEAIAAVAKEIGLPKREVYAAVVAAK
jgi:16S rRNA (cytidine1402-2'-O)-methyltransferase